MTISEKPNVVIPADHVPGPKQGQWTYGHYAALPNDGQRYETVDGVLYTVPPSPTEWHQRSAGRFIYYLLAHVELAGRGRVYHAPFDVELTSKTVLQPDVLVLLNESCGKITSSHITGAPDLVVEVLSPGTAQYDWQQKYDAYAQAGVREYWIGDPINHTLEVLVLENGEYHSTGIFRGEQVVLSKIVPEFPVQARQFFPE